MKTTSINLSLQRLTDSQHPLLRKFYREHKSSMRISAQAEVWVVRGPMLMAGVCLTAVAHGYWLTSLFTAPAYRQQGVAGFLIEQLKLSHKESPIWLFCHPDLCGFYNRLGFQITEHLPETLQSRLQRYQQHKPLIAMLYFKQ